MLPEVSRVDLDWSEAAPSRKRLGVGSAKISETAVLAVEVLTD